METSPLLLALKVVVFLGFVRSPFLFVLDSFLLAYLNFTRSSFFVHKSVSIQLLIFYLCYITMALTFSMEGSEMSENTTGQLTVSPTTSTCVVCGSVTTQQREGVMYECEHCMNEHED